LDTRYVDAVVTTAHQISRRLGYSPGQVLSPG